MSALSMTLPAAWSTPLTEGATVPVRDLTSSDQTAELYKGKRFVIFSLPGAYTPLCSSEMLPGYLKHYGTAAAVTVCITAVVCLLVCNIFIHSSMCSDEILSLGVSDVFCVSVNDAFVMRQVGAAYNRHPAMSLLFSDRLMMMMYSGVSTKDWTPRKPTLPAQSIPETLRRSSSFLTELPFSPAEW